MHSAAAAAVGAGENSQLRRLHRHHEVVCFSERLGSDAVVRPAAFLSIEHQSRILQHTEVERESRLSGVEVVLEIADALFPAPKLLEDAESRLIGQRMKELRRASRVDGGRRCPGLIISSIVVASSRRAARFRECRSARRRPRVEGAELPHVSLRIAAGKRPPRGPVVLERKNNRGAGALRPRV